MTSIRRQVIRSTKVGYYAKRVLDDLSVKEPPVLYRPVLEYFGIGLHEYTRQTEMEFMQQNGAIISAPAFLIKSNGNPRIYIKEDETQERRRLSIFHECGHFDLPWHEKFNFICDCGCINPNDHKKVEKEAFEYAARLMFPDFLFFDDLHSMPLNIQTIGLLAKRYNASFIATAINFVKLNPFKCAMILLEYNYNVNEDGYHYRVLYSVKSKRFHRYWHKDDGVFYNDFIQSCFEYGRYWEEEIPAVVFGSEKKICYQAFMRKYGDQVFVLLVSPDNQGKLI